MGISRYVTVWAALISFFLILKCAGSENDGGDYGGGINDQDPYLCAGLFYQNIVKARTNNEF